MRTTSIHGLMVGVLISGVALAGFGWRASVRRSHVEMLTGAALAHARLEVGDLSRFRVDVREESGGVRVDLCEFDRGRPVVSRRYRATGCDYGLDVRVEAAEAPEAR